MKLICEIASALHLCYTDKEYHYDYHESTQAEKFFSESIPLDIYFFRAIMKSISRQYDIRLFKRWDMTKEDKKNAYLYCKFRDEQFALYDEYAKCHGMMMKTLLVVNVLFYAKDGLTQTEICRRTFQSKQTVNLIVKHLLADNYVTVREVPENRRNKMVRMTREGRAYCENVVRHITWAEDTAMSMFTPEEQEQLIDLSRRFTKNLTMLINQETED